MKMEGDLRNFKIDFRTNGSKVSILQYNNLGKWLWLAFTRITLGF